jgi:hypothetical protein
VTPTWLLGYHEESIPSLAMRSQRQEATGRARLSACSRTTWPEGGGAPRRTPCRSPELVPEGGPTRSRSGVDGRQLRLVAHFGRCCSLKRAAAQLVVACLRSTLRQPARASVGRNHRMCRVPVGGRSSALISRRRLRDPRAATPRRPGAMLPKAWRGVVRALNSPRSRTIGSPMLSHKVKSLSDVRASFTERGAR